MRIPLGPSHYIDTAQRPWLPFTRPKATPLVGDLKLSKLVNTDHTYRFYMFTTPTFVYLPPFNRGRWAKNEATNFTELRVTYVQVRLGWDEGICADTIPFISLTQC